MELKKNDRVMYENRLGTVMSELGYYKVITKDTWIDVLFDDDEFICQVRKDYLRKVNTYDTKNRFKEIVKVEEGFDMSKLHKLNIYIDMKPSIMFNKLEEEVKEVMFGLICNDTENIAEELLDVMQVCLGIATVKGIDLKDYIEDHNKKLLNRKHRFI